MRTFNTFAQLKEASLLTGTPTSVLFPARIEGTVKEQGLGLHLKSGNVFSTDFVDQESTTGRKIVLVADEFKDNLTNTINRFKKDNLGNWVGSDVGLTSAIFYNGQLWFPTSEVGYTESGYPIVDWEIIGDILQISTGKGDGDAALLYERYKGLSDPAYTPASAHYTGDGEIASFRVPVDIANPLLVQVYLGGLRQDPASAYTLSNNNVIMSSAPTEGIAIDIYTFNSVMVSNTVPQSYVDNMNKLKSKEVNNILTLGTYLEWAPGTKVEDTLQVYLYEGHRYLPNPDEVPFTTGSIFEPYRFELSVVDQLISSITNLFTHRRSTMWESSLRVVNPLALYNVPKADGSKDYYMASSVEVPFVTGETFAGDLSDGKWTRVTMFDLESRISALEAKLSK